MHTFAAQTHAAPEEDSEVNSSNLEGNNLGPKFESFKWFYFILPFEIHVYSALTITFLNSEFELASLIMIFIGIKALKVFYKLALEVKRRNKLYSLLLY